MSIKIKEVLCLIEEQTGLRLNLCNDFPGIHFFNGRPYFNITLEHRLSESTEYNTLERFALVHPGVNVEPNGLKRIAVFFT